MDPFSCLWKGHTFGLKKKLLNMKEGRERMRVVRRRIENESFVERVLQSKQEVMVWGNSAK